MPTQISLQVHEDEYRIWDAAILPPIGTKIDVDRAFSKGGAWFTVEVLQHLYEVHSQGEGEADLIKITIQTALVSVPGR